MDYTWLQRVTGLRPRPHPGPPHGGPGPPHGGPGPPDHLTLLGCFTARSQQSPGKKLPIRT